MSTSRLTMAQALVRFLTRQYVERDGREQRLIVGVWGIFGHGNVAGIGQALHQYGDGMRYVLSRNEQAQVHAAAAYARARNRLQTWACTSSVGPGATNMITGAAAATINRVPVLLLPGDVFASRRPAPVLQQLESPWSQDVSVNDAFAPVSRYWDRINRPEQILAAAPEAMRVLTSPAETGAVTLALPQDVQAEAYDYPDAFFRKRVWHVGRPLPDVASLDRAAALIRSARAPLIVAGGGVIYAEATAALHTLAECTGIPVAETQAGKGALRYDHPSSLGALGVTGTPGANVLAREADVVIGVGTRWSDFTTASKTGFQHPEVRFINVNVAELDANKHAGIALLGDARATLEALSARLRDWRVPGEYRARALQLNQQWNARVEAIYGATHGERPSQGEVIGAVELAAGDDGVVVCAAGSLPGDLHKLWRARHPKAYHLEYGYSCMGYEVAGGLGVRMAEADREVYVMVGDGSWLMMSSEIATAIQEGVRFTVVLIDNHGFASIGGLSRSLGSEGFGTAYRDRDGRPLAVDFVENARSLGARAVRATTITDLHRALEEARSADRVSVIVVETDPSIDVGSFESWWDVPVAEVSEQDAVRAARARYESQRTRERWHL